MKKINEQKTYSLAEIARLKLLPGKKSFTAVKNEVMRDRVGANVLRTKILGEGRATRVYIEGKNLIKFLSQ